MYMCMITEHNIETLEYLGFVDSLGMQWFLPSIQAAVDFIKKQKLLKVSRNQCVNDELFFSYKILKIHDQ